MLFNKKNKMKKTQLIILGAGKPHFGKKASAIINILYSLHCASVMF